MNCNQSSYEVDEGYGDDFKDDMDRLGSSTMKKNAFESVVPDSVGASNIGFKMLQKFGWKGNGLGKSEQGITVPVMVVQTDATLGIGKATEYEQNIVEVTRDRRKMDVEIDQTVDIIKKKKDATERQEIIENDLKIINQEFFCDSCNKQYKNVAEMANHLSSYDHHHKKRFKEMRDIDKKRKRGFAIGESDEVRKEEIRKKEEKRLAKDMENRINKAKSFQHAATSSSVTSTLPPSSSSLSSMILIPPPPLLVPIHSSSSSIIHPPPPPPPVFTPREIKGPLNVPAVKSHDMSALISTVGSSSSSSSSRSDDRRFLNLTNKNTNSEESSCITIKSLIGETASISEPSSSSSSSSTSFDSVIPLPPASSVPINDTYLIRSCSDVVFTEIPEPSPSSIEEVPVKKISFSMKASFLKKK